MANLKNVLILLAVCFHAGMSQTTQPKPTPAEIVKVSRCVLDEKCATWLSYKRYDGKSAQVVFVSHGKRYTIYAVLDSVPEKFDGLDANRLSGMMSFWVRPDGTKETSVLDTFSADLLGNVGFGIDGPRKKELFVEKNNQGIQWQGYWQDRFNSAFGETLAYIGEHSKR